MRDIRSPRQTELPESFDMDRFLSDLVATPNLVCDHQSFDVLRNYSGQFDDHETLDARCQTCGAFVNVTIYSTRDDTEMSPMDAGYLKRQGYADRASC